MSGSGASVLRQKFKKFSKDQQQQKERQQNIQQQNKQQDKLQN